MIRKLLREPVLHFLLIGVAIFVAYGLVGPPDREGNRIVVSRAIVDAMVREHEARWHRAPTEQELAGLVESHVRDEILYREGAALRLDRDDPVIKRRVRQKLEVIAEEQQARDAPTDVDLAAYLAQHADVSLVGALSASSRSSFPDQCRLRRSRRCGGRRCAARIRPS
jgi:hypothetical protein